MDKDAIKANIKLAKGVWGSLTRPALEELRALTSRYDVSVALGDVLYLGGHWYVTHAGLLRVASTGSCSGIRVVRLRELCDPSARRWVFKAIVYKSPDSRGFVGYGDADPSNVSSLVHGAEMRVAETRAVNRALRKAYGIGLCSVEELGWAPRQAEPNHPATASRVAAANGHNGHGSSQPRLRDRLCLLIRQHHLDAGQVKAYAADYCGTPTLRDASRESVEAFIARLAEEAANDRDALLCRLNSYPRTEEAHS